MKLTQSGISIAKETFHFTLHEISLHFCLINKSSRSAVVVFCISCPNLQAASLSNSFFAITDNWGVSRTFFYEILVLVAASVECSCRIVEVTSCYEISRAINFFASPAHKMLTSMPLMSKSGQIMASVEFSRLSVSHFRENSRAVELKFW